MRKPITFINVALLVAAIWMAATIRTTWRRNHARYGLFAATLRTVPSVPAGITGSAGAAAPVQGQTPASYTEVVALNLFSADRNNEQPVTKAEKKPKPPVPVVIGTLNLGSGMVALMAEPAKASQGGFRRVKVGDDVGGFRVAEIAEHKVVIEFEGEKTTIDVYESAESVRPAATMTAASTAEVPRVVSTAPTPEQNPPQSAAQAQQTAPGGANAPPNANALGMPAVTTEGCRKKYTRQTPWGVQAWYEDIPGCRQ